MTPTRDWIELPTGLLLLHDRKGSLRAIVEDESWLPHILTYNPAAGTATLWVQGDEGWVEFPIQRWGDRLIPVDLMTGYPYVWPTLEISHALEGIARAWNLKVHQTWDPTDYIEDAVGELPPHWIGWKAP